MIFAILGKGGAGKDTIVSRVSEGLNIPIATSFTTRPMRDREVDGREYYFIDKNKFWGLHDNNRLAEYTSYNVASGDTWYYGLMREELEKNDNILVIVNPHGFYQLEAIYGNSITSVLIDCDDMVRLQRAIDRDTKGNALEICRRMLADHEDFERLATDYTINNEYNLDEAVSELKTIIKNNL